MAGVKIGYEANDVGQTFEFLCPRLGRTIFGGIFSLRRRTRRALLEKLKYLMACLEDVNRLHSLRLRLEQCSRSVDQCGIWRKRSAKCVMRSGMEQPTGVFVFMF